MAALPRRCLLQPVQSLQLNQGKGARNHYALVHPGFHQGAGGGPVIQSRLCIPDGRRFQLLLIPAAGICPQKPKVEMYIPGERILGQVHQAVDPADASAAIHASVIHGADTLSPGKKR